MKDICNCCKKEKEIVNSFFKLCLGCNLARLSNKKVNKVKVPKEKNIESKNTVKMDFKINKGSEGKKMEFKPTTTPHKAPNKIKLDEEFYEKCFNLSNHECEECGTPLPDIFRGDKGEVLARWRYSHIMAKSIAPQHRYNTDNINHLCMSCHQIWDQGDKKTMKIYVKNLVLWGDFLNL